MGAYQNAVYVYCCVVNISFVKFTYLILLYMNNGKMECGNENPTQPFALMIEENHQKSPVRLVGTGI